MGVTEEQEIQRALAYRRRWDSRIAYRANQLRQLSGQPAAYQQMWENYRKIYDKTNYVYGDSEVEFFSPFDVDDPGGISASPIRLPRTKQSRRREP